MGSYRPVGFWAKATLVAALFLVVLGTVLLQVGVGPFWSFWAGLIRAFGEAALVGGLADWFAVRALFSHPLGIKIFPHTALIPRNRERIVREIRNLVQNEWLTKDMLAARVNEFDFVQDGVLSLVVALKPKLRPVLRTIAREVLSEVSPQQLAAFLSQSAGQVLDAGKMAPFLAEIIRRAREEGWLEPILHEFVVRFQEWASSPENRAVIHRHLKQAASLYRDKSMWKNLTLSVAEWSGGIDLKDASAVLQEQITRFAEEQLSSDSDVRQLVNDGLVYLEGRLRDDPEFTRGLQDYIQGAAQSGSLAALLDPVLASLQAEGMRAVHAEDSQVLGWAQERLQGWVDRLAQDPDSRQRLNGWCRRTVNTLIERHHSLIGAMVEDRLSRFSDENLVTMIENKVGEDLNWIRINGSLVGGFVGVLLYLLITVIEGLCHLA